MAEQQQTWLEWMFGSASGAQTDSTKTSDATASSNELTSATKSASPYGPYVRTGRGGAGNFTWQSQVRSEEANKNLESQQPSTLEERREVAARIEHSDTDAALRSQQTSRSAAPQYIRVGRGYVQSTDLPQHFDPPRTPAKPTNDHVDQKPPASASMYKGRGGAGNFAAVAAMSEKEQAERAEREQRLVAATREQVAQDVETQLSPPPGAYFAK